MEKIEYQDFLDFLNENNNPAEALTQFQTLMAYYECAIMEVETKFNVLNKEFSLQHDRNPINGIKSRLKSVISIKQKIQARDFPLSMKSIEENIFDIAGIRVICSFLDDVYVLADALLKQDDVTLIAKKDYIKNPKPNGYRSLHLIISIPIFLHNEKRSMKVEVQLRTISMDSWASLEHQLRYKKDTPYAEAMADELKHCAELSCELDNKMEALRALAESQL